HRAGRRAERQAARSEQEPRFQFLEQQQASTRPVHPRTLGWYPRRPAPLHVDFSRRGSSSNRHASRARDEGKDPLNMKILTYFNYMTDNETRRPCRGGAAQPRIPKAFWSVALSPPANRAGFLAVSQVVD